MKHNYQQKYKNVFIRQLVEEDMEYLRVWRNDPNNARFLRKIPYITSDMQQNWFQAYLADNDEMTFAIEETNVIKGIVGSMALYNFANDEAEFGKILIGDPNAHGKSVGVNALEAIKMIAKDKLNLSKLYLHVYSENEAAVKVYKKAGFKIESKHVAENGLDEYTMEVLL